MGVYGDKARKMKATIEAIEQLIGDDDAKLATDKHLVADLALIEVSLTLVNPLHLSSLPQGQC